MPQSTGPIAVRNLRHPPPFVGTRLVEIGRRRILIVRFGALRKEFRRSFGIHLKRLQDAVYLARAYDASLYILWYKAAPNQAVNRLTSPDVPVLRSSRTRDAIVLAFWVATSPLTALGRVLQPLKLRLERRQRTLEKQRRARRKRDERRVRGVAVEMVGEQLARFASFLLGWTDPADANGKLALRKEMATDPIHLQLPRALEKEARAQAARLGLQPDARIVTLHVREPGWRPFEDDQRSCDITTYRPAVEELVERGFRVVRIGDASMSPIDWPGVLDLATEPARTDLLELWCVLHSVFFFGSESGPLELARLVGLPALLVNVKTVQSGYPVHPSDLLIMKRMLASDATRVLSLREQLAVKAGALTLTGRARYVDNTPEEILAALDEMMQSESSSAPETPAQAEFRRLASSKVVNGAERERYLGAGRIARFFADRYLDHSEPLEHRAETGQRS